MLKFELIGNLGSDAESKLINGKKATVFSVGHNEYVRDGQPSTTWVSVTRYTGETDNLLQYLKKGVKVFVRGNGTARTYTDKNGQVQCGLSVFATEIELCGGSVSQTTNSNNNNTDASTSGNVPF